MYPPIDPRKMAVARALYEGAPDTYVRLGLLMECHPDTVRKYAAREGWGKPGSYGQKAGAVRKRRRRPTPPTAQAGDEVAYSLASTAPGELRSFIESQIAEIMARSTDNVMDKADADTLMALLRIVEKSAVFGSVGQAEEQPTDEEIAEVLQRINDRIIELAREFAREFPNRFAGEEFSVDRGQEG